MLCLTSTYVSKTQKSYGRTLRVRHSFLGFAFYYTALFWLKYINGKNISLRSL